MNWYKKSYNRGIPRMDEYSDGKKGLEEKEKEFLQRNDPMGGNERPGYPSDLQSRDLREDTDYGKLHGQIPGENVLMDKDPDPGEGVNHDEFVSSGESNVGEGYANNDKAYRNELSRKLDKGDMGPHNMPHGNGVFRTIRERSKMRGGLNLY